MHVFLLRNCAYSVYAWPKFVSMWSGRVGLGNIIGHSPKRSNGHSIFCKARKCWLWSCWCSTPRI